MAPQQSLNPLNLTVICLALALVTLQGCNPRGADGTNRTAEQATGIPGILERVDRTNELHAGYGVYPPYTQEDPNTRAVSGFSVDIINEIGSQLNCKVVWHRLNWNTMSADLRRGEYDVIADPIFQTIPRAREFAFSEPYANFADGIAVVKKSEGRFTTLDSMDQVGVTIAVGQGWASETLLKTRFHKARIVSVQTATDLLQVFNEVLAGRADAAVADGADAERFVKEHSSAVKTLWLDNPPAAMPAGFALRPNDLKGAAFFSVCLRNLASTGVIAALEKKYGIRSLRLAVQ
jgi:ABC-type amino acid transport substrate-binding protein